MRKLWAILLIVSITCVEVSIPTQDEILNLFDMDEAELNIFKKIGNGIKKGFNVIKKGLKGAWNIAKKGINWLKKKGLWNHIKSLLKTVGKTAATAACSSYIPKEACSTVINSLL